MKLVSKKSTEKSDPMKISVPRLSAVLLILCSPLFMMGNKTSRFSEVNHPEKVLPVTPKISHAVAVLSAVDMVYQNSRLADVGVSKHVFALAMKGFDKLSKKGVVSKDSILTIVDFSKSSKQKRMVVIDLKNYAVLFNTVVAHGRNTGAEFARSFSNAPRSNKSSLGFYITSETYMGSNGYSLKLDGFEKGINDKARERAIVMHGADYANEKVIDRKGYLGRSFGCPAVPQHLTKKIINTIKNGNVLFVYYPDKKYLNRSELLNG